MGWRSLVVVYESEPSRDRVVAGRTVDGCRFVWPDGEPVQVGLEAFCGYGRRLIGLGCGPVPPGGWRVEMLCAPRRGPDDDYPREPGLRVRRFYLERHGDRAWVHAANGTRIETAAFTEADDPRVREWIGLDELPDGGRLWFDFAARPVVTS